jgi:hypothetical protein
MKRKWLKGLTPLAASAALAVSSTQAWATSLPVGGSVTPSIVSGTGVSSGVSILADSGWLSSATVDGSGQVREIVLSGDKNNSLGGLDFIYQVQNTSASGSGVNLAGMDAFSYGSFATNVLAANPNGTSFTNGSNSFGTPGPGGNDPTGATRSNNGGGVGNQVTFLFGSSGSGNLTPGSYSDLLVVQTAATNYAAGVIDFFDGGTSDHLAGFQPAAHTTPEPSSVVLLSVCLAALGVFGACQRRKEVAPSLS